MKKIKIKKFRSYKLFIFLGLIFTMFTAFIINFKSYAYDSDDENHLINNNIIPCNNIVLNEGYVNGQFIGLYGAHSYESTNNIWKFTYTADSRDLVNNKLNLYFDVGSVNYVADNYLFYFLYDDLQNVAFSFGSTNNLVFPTYTDDWYSINNMDINITSTYFNYNGVINLMKFQTLNNLTIGDTYTWWFFLNVVPVDSIFDDNSFNPSNVDDIYYSSLETQDLFNQISSLQYDNNSLRSLNLRMVDEIQRLTDANRVLSNQLANANNDYNLNNLVWSIGGTPFETFKTIWNFEFFGVNISNLIFGLLTGLIIIWIIKKFFL